MDTDESDKENDVDAEEDEPQLNLPKLQRYKPSTYALDSFCTVAGKRGLGKSVWIQWLLSHMHKCYKEVYVFTKTKHNYFWQQHAPDSYIYPGWDPEIGRQIIDEAKMDFERILDGDKEIKSCPYRLVILDDVISDDISRDKVLTDLVFAGRHYHIGVISAIQDVKGFGPKIRGNSDLIVTTHQAQKRTLECLFEDYASFFGREGKNVFQAIMRKYTKDHGVLVIDQTKARYKFQDMFFWDRADPNPKPYFLGWAQQWNDSGDDWHAQLKRAKNKLSVDRDKTQEYVIRKLETLKRKDNSMFRMNSDLDDSSAIIPSNGLNLAPPEIRKGMREEYNKRNGFSNSIRADIEKRVDEVLAKSYVAGAMRHWL